jgi:ATP-binding cassette, subfamily B, bacterial
VRAARANGTAPKVPPTLLGFLRPYRTRFALVYALAAVTAVLELLPPLFTKRLIDAGIGGHSFSEVVRSTLWIVGVSLLAGGISLLQGWHNAIASERTLRDLRRAIVGHLCYVPLAFFARARRGEIMNRIAGDVEMIRRSVSRGVLSLAQNAFQVVALSVAMLLLDWRLAAVTFVSAAAFAVPVALVVRRLTRASMALNERRDDLTSLVQRVYSLSGMFLLRSFGAQAFELANATGIGRHAYEARRRFGKRNQELLFVGGLLVVIVPALVWLVGGLQLFAGRGSVGTIVAFQSFALRVFAALSMLSALGSQVVNASTSFARIRQTLDLATEDRGGDDARAALAAVPEIDARNVRLAYEHAGERFALNGLDLRLTAPGYYAVVGPSGSGKSSLLYALHKHAVPAAGTLTAGGRATAELAAPSLRDAAAVVLQDVFLQNATLLDNVRYGRPDAAPDEVEAAANAVFLGDVVAGFPGGWSHLAGDRGSNLSGGQRQRVALARGLLQDAPVLVLDEATNEIDFVMEQRILSEIRRRYRDRLLIHVTHRLTTCSDADRIFVVADGRVAEAGTHDELIARDGVYAKLFTAWTREASAPLTQVNA